jgi:energy-coupling factor transport system ATP-binding protein
MSSSPNAIEVSNLSFRYPDASLAALDNISLSIRSGVCVAIIGHSGCGKSTLCYTFNGLIPNFISGRLDGSVAINGVSISGRPTAVLGQSVGLLFQDFESQLFSTTCELEVAFGPENYRLPPAELRCRVDKYLKLVGLDGLRRCNPATLSGGQKQRLAVGSVLALEPGIVVLDEPTTDLDAEGQASIHRLALDIRRSERTLVMVEHDVQALGAADEIVLMKHGRVVTHDRADGVLQDVELLAECGVRPPQLAQLLHILGVGAVGLTVADCLVALKKSGRRAHRIAASPSLAGASTPAVLELRDVSYAYPAGRGAALREVSLTVRDGEFIAVVGGNGSGKTTLGMLLSGLLVPTDGTVMITGTDARSLRRPALAKLAGYVFQNPDNQIFSSTVAREVSFAPKNFGIPPGEIDTRVSEALRAVRLDGVEQDDPFALTKGQRQRVAVASVLVSRPRVLILDEPTTGLDYQQQRGMMDMLARLNRQGHTVIIITHSMWAACDYASRTLVLRDGSIVLDGPTRDVFAMEDILASAGLRPPPIVQLSNRLGVGALTVPEMVTALSGPGD